MSLDYISKGRRVGSDNDPVAVQFHVLYGNKEITIFFAFHHVMYLRSQVHSMVDFSHGHQGTVLTTAKIL